jgi:hypothetical protein
MWFVRRAGFPDRLDHPEILILENYLVRVGRTFKGWLSVVCACG